MHIIQVLYDQRMVQLIKILANVNTGSQYSMRLPQVQCGINKM